MFTSFMVIPKIGFARTGALDADQAAELAKAKPRQKKSCGVVEATGPTAQSRALSLPERHAVTGDRPTAAGEIQNREYSWLPKQVKLRANRQCTRAKAARVRCPCMKEPQFRIAPLAAMRAFRQARALCATNLLSRYYPDSPISRRRGRSAAGQYTLCFGRGARCWWAPGVAFAPGRERGAAAVNRVSC